MDSWYLVHEMYGKFQGTGYLTISHVFVFFYKLPLLGVVISEIRGMSQVEKGRKLLNSV